MKRTIIICLLLCLLLCGTASADNLLWSLPQEDDIELESGMSGEAVVGLQIDLAGFGIEVGSIDGVYGTDTECAVKLFQLRMGLEQTGIADCRTLAYLRHFPKEDFFLTDDETGICHLPACCAGTDGCRMCEAIPKDGICCPLCKPEALDISLFGTIRCYVLNMHTMKFHHPNCYSVEKINPENRRDYAGTRESVLNMGYVPCKNCDP